MFSTSQFKPLGYLHVSPINKFPSSYSASSSSSPPTSMKKFTRVVYNLVVTRVRGMCRAVSEVQCKLVRKLKEIEFTDYLKQPLLMWKRMNKKRRSYCKSKYQVKICGSFRFHYNWASSRALPAVPIEPAPTALFRYGSTRYSSIISAEEEHYNTTTTGAGVGDGAGGAPESSQNLSALLYWLEQNNVVGDEDGNCNGNEPKNNDSSSTAASITTEGKKEDVDELAEKFILSCHEKFRLEKEESYRAFQEMMARSL